MAVPYVDTAYSDCGASKQSTGGEGEEESGQMTVEDTVLLLKLKDVSLVTPMRLHPHDAIIQGESDVSSHHSMRYT